MYELASSCNAHADFKSGWQAAIISLWGSAHSLWELVDLYTCVQELVYNSLSEPQLTGGLRAAQRLFRHRGCLVSCQIRVWSLLSAPYMETFPGNQLLPVSSQVATVRWKKSKTEKKRARKTERERETVICEEFSGCPPHYPCSGLVGHKLKFDAEKNSIDWPQKVQWRPLHQSSCLQHRRAHKGDPDHDFGTTGGDRKICFHEKLQSWFVIPAKLPEMMYGQILEAFAKPLGKRWPSVAALRLRGKGALHY